jgi:hypothetical protein
MAGAFPIITTLAFEHEFRTTSRGNAALIRAFDELVAILAEDPQPQRPAQNQKLQGLRPGEWQWRATIPCAATYSVAKRRCSRSDTERKPTNLGRIPSATTA